MIKYRFGAVASVSAICVASAFATNTARAQNIAIEPSQAPAISALAPSQDYADDSYPAEQNQRVAQFFPFFFSEPQRPRPEPQYQYQGRPHVQPQPQTQQRIIQRRPADQTARKVARHGSSEKEHILSLLRNPPAVTQPKGPVLITVSIAKQKIVVYDAGVQIAEAPISSGTIERPTPMGVFSVLEKSWWHRSNMYSAAPMPFMQRITWSGVAIHAGELPGYRASHGCVRLPESFALRLWYLTRVNARVIIGWNEMAPLAIDHPLLFQPGTIPLPPNRPEPPAATPPEEAIISMNAPAPDASQDDPADQADGVPVAAIGQPEPQEDVALVDDDPELDHMMMASADDGAGMYDDPTQTQQYGLQLPLLPASLDASATDFLRPKPPTGLFAMARRKIARHTRTHTRSASIPDPELDAVLRPGPVSVLVSRKERRLYVRKGMQPVFSMPIAVREPDRAIGTHVYTAMTASDDGKKLNWMVVSPASEPLNRAASLQPTAAAFAALDRLDIPQETIDRITPLVSTGATLIVTDAGLGRTANLLDSDYTVLLRPEVVASHTPKTPRPSVHSPRPAPQYAPPPQRPADSFFWFR